MLIPQHLTSDQHPVVAFTPVVTRTGFADECAWIAVIRRDDLTARQYGVLSVFIDPDDARKVRADRGEYDLELEDALTLMVERANLTGAWSRA